MKKFSRLLCFVVVFITVMAAFCTVSFAATVGESLKSPENGWTRIDDNNTLIKYTGSFLRYDYDTSFYKGTGMRIAYSNKSGNAEFMFYGTKVRIISYSNDIGSGYSENIQIKVDGVVAGTYSSACRDNNYQILAFEQLNLPVGTHTVEVTPQDLTTYGTILDAIDIDDTGYLVDINAPTAPTNLDAIAGNKKVDLKWDAVEGSTIYNVKRSLTPGGPYETITTTSAITYTDTNVANGTTYYYVVTAVIDGKEGPNSNEASATPTGPVITGNSSILEITMVTGEIKEYDLTAAELQSFLTWYDGRSNGADKAYYMIPKKNNIKPFLSRKEYIAFDKISSFEVKEYTE